MVKPAHVLSAKINSKHLYIFGKVIEQENFYGLFVSVLRTETVPKTEKNRYIIFIFFYLYIFFNRTGRMKLTVQSSDF